MSKQDTDTLAQERKKLHSRLVYKCVIVAGAKETTLENRHHKSFSSFDKFHGYVTIAKSHTGSTLLAETFPSIVTTN